MGIKKTTPSKKDIKKYEGITGGITVAPYILSAKQISDWLISLNAANSTVNPNRKKLYDIFHRIELDAQIETVTNLRTIAVTNKKINFLKADGAEDEIISDQIRAPWFHSMMEYAMQAEWWGHSLIEFNLANGLVDKTVLIPRYNVDPDRNQIYIHWADRSQGIPFLEPPESDYVFEVRGSRKLGLYGLLTPYVLYKAGSFGDWAQFSELFGLPFREITYDPFDPTTRDQAKKAMDEMGAAGYIILPNGTSVKIHDSSRTGSDQVFQALVNTCDEQIAKAVLGGTMVTDNGSSQAQAKVHYAVKEEINLSDLVKMEYILNWQVKPRLLKFGMPVGDGLFQFDRTRQIPLETRIVIDMQIAQRIPIAPKYWYETYGIPEPDAASVKVENPENDDVVQPSQQDDPALPPLGKKITPKPNQKKKTNLSDHHHIIVNGIDICCINLADVPEDDQSDLETSFNNAAEFIYNNPGSEIIPMDLFMTSYQTIMKGLTDNWNKPILSIAYNQPDNSLIAYLRSNISAFSGAKSLTMQQEMTKLILDADGKVKSFSQFKRDLKPLYGTFNQAYLQAEYNQAIASAQMASKWADMWQNRELFPNLKYVTAGDARVRPAHRLLDGIILPIESLFWDIFYPPNGWNCRCTVVQMPDTAALSEEKEAMALGKEIKQPDYFAQNVGKTGIIWNNEMPYFNAGDPNIFSAIKNYGMKPVEKIYIDPGKLPAFAGGKPSLSREGSVGVLTDVLQNKIFFPDKFKSDFMSDAKNVLEKPDEIWSVKNKNKIAQHYIKYYQDGPLVLKVNPNLKDGTIKAVSLEINNDAEKIRTGSLLHKK